MVKLLRPYLTSARDRAAAKRLARLDGKVGAYFIHVGVQWGERSWSVLVGLAQPAVQWTDLTLRPPLAS